MVIVSVSAGQRSLYDVYAETYPPAELLLQYIFHQANADLLPA